MRMAMSNPFERDAQRRPPEGDERKASPSSGGDESIRETLNLPRLSRDPSTTAFAPGDLIAHRFRVARFIARGGMGEVFEAEDLELRERVALKTIRPEIAEDETVMERFRREIQIARKVTHPNVSRVFDLFHHEGPEVERIAFLTMELLLGESLGQRLRSRGRLSAIEAEPLVRQMVAGLSAAHDAGIVHRDFKPDNVMLVDSAAGTRVVVTDFGLARSGATVESETVTGSRTILGTPAYMAPEQVEGSAATPATDVYALGIVLFEMLTGKRPFEGDTPIAAAVKRLKEDAPSPRRFVPDLDAHWERVILKCLERDPARRFSRASDVSSALSAGKTTPVFTRRRLLVVATLLAGAASAASMFLRTDVPRTEDTPPPVALDPLSVQVRPSIAVLGFRNLSDRSDAAWLSTALSEMLTTELSSGEQVRVLSGESVGRLKSDLALVPEDGYARDTLEKIRTHARVDFVLLGSYLALGEPAGGSLRMNLRLQDTKLGETTAALAESGTETNLVELVAKLGASLRERMGVTAAAEDTERALRASLPTRAEAIKLYSDGLSRLRVFDYRGAREALDQAVRLEPGHPLIRSALAEAWWRLGYRARAQEEAKAAFESAGTLPLEERLSIEARYRGFSEREEDRDTAIRLYQTLLDSYPDEIEYGLALAGVQKPAQALETTDALKKLPGGLGEDPRIDLREAEAAENAGELKRSLAAAERAANKAEKRGARLVVAEAVLLSGKALRALDEVEGAIRAAEKARTLYLAAGDPLGASEAQRILAWSTLSRDELLAKSIFADSIALAREVGALPQVALSLEGFAQLLGNNGDHQASLRMAEEALSLWREVGDKVDMARGLNVVAWAHYLQGNVGRAEKLQRQSLAEVEAVGATGTLRYPLFEVARLRFERGYLQEAKKLMEQSLSLERAEGTPVAWSLMHLAEVLEEQGRFDEAYRAYAQAVEIYEDNSEKRSLADARLMRVDLLLADSRFEDAKAEVEATRGLTQDPGASVRTAIVSARMSWILSRLGDDPGAARERDRARQPLSDLPPEVTMWQVDELGMAFVELGDLHAATQCFEASRDIAKRSKNPLDVSFSEQRMATVLHLQGRLNEAQGLLERVIVTQTQLESIGNAVDARFRLASVAADGGDLETARKLHEENVVTANRLGMNRRAAYGELDRFDVSLAAGKTIANRDRIVEIAEAFRKEELTYGESYALYVLARDARFREDLPRARESIARAKELADRIVIRRHWNAWHLGYDLRRLVRLEAAHIQGLTGNLATSLGEIDAIEAEATRLNHLPLLLGARLVRGELRSREAEGRLELERLEREANERGFCFIATRARAVRLGAAPSR